MRNREKNKSSHGERTENNIENRIVTKGKVLITESVREVDQINDRKELLERINREKGAYFCSNFEYPGRYSRWDIGFSNPALEIQTKGRSFELEGLTEKGGILLKIIHQQLMKNPHIEQLSIENLSGKLVGKIIKEKNESIEIRTEENRSHKPSIFSLIRSIQELFHLENGAHQESRLAQEAQSPRASRIPEEPKTEFLGLYGAYGYELVFQFEEIERNKEHLEGIQREQSDIHLFLPDEIFVIDHRLGKAFVLEYEFQKDEFDTRRGERRKIKVEGQKEEQKEVHKVEGEGLQNEPLENKAYRQLVEKAIPHFLRGDFFEVVPSHVLRRNCEEKPSELFQELLGLNPSPYGFLINLGDEHLIGASPEMYVRVEGKRVETCPISGTAKRGKNAIEDYENIMILLNSEKEESELTMCTDVDRNDKSRICIPGTIKVIGRRQIEIYSHLMHTVDHVEGYLREGFDGIDAFMTHMWAVTVTGAPKKAAMTWIEKNEESARGWYGGAVGLIGFDGNVNTGLTLRTIRLRKGVAEIRVGATVLYGSDPESEEKETLTKGAALLEVVRRVKERNFEAGKEIARDKEENLAEKKAFRVVLVDHEDSFVHTLGDYFRKQGAEVQTVRYQKAVAFLKENKPDLALLSPGPGRPVDFQIHKVISHCEKENIAILGICLGMQGIIEYFGGSLGVLKTPRHGKTSVIEATESSKLFKGLGKSFQAGRYHSLYGLEIPEGFNVVGVSKEDQIPMAIEHKEKKIFGLQFHPESLMTLREEAGEKIIKNLLEVLRDEG